MDKERVCLDCGISIKERPYGSVRCKPCQVEYTRKRVAERSRKRYVPKILKPLFCLDCKKPMERGKYRGNKIRCESCRKEFKVKYAREYEEVIVLKSCLECQELMVVERKEGEHLGKYRNYCPTCRPKHYGRRKFGYVPNLMRTCPECKKEMTYYHMRPYNGVFYCVKCKKKKINRERHENALKKREEYKKRMEEVVLERNSRYCVDCNKKIEGIPPRNWNTIRCKPCQATYSKATTENRINKRIGTVSMIRNLHIEKDKDGNPDWAKEAEKIKKLKHKTYYPYKGDYKNRRMEEHLRKNTHTYKPEGEDG